MYIQDLVHAEEYALTDLPEPVRGQLVSAIDECLLVGIANTQEGPTTVVVTDNRDDIPAALVEKFRGTLPCPSRRLSFVGVVDQLLREVRVTSDLLAIEIFANDDVAPDVVAFLVRTQDERPVLESVVRPNVK